MQLPTVHSKESWSMSVLFTVSGESGAQSIRLLFVLGVVATLTPHVQAQYIGLGLPFQNATESYYQRTGVGFSFWLPGSTTGKGVVGLMPNGQFTPDGRVHFSQGGMGSALPPFGGYDSGADARVGFAYNGSGGGFRLNLALGQGNSRAISHTTPSLVVPHGVSGWIYSGQWRPFVTGLYPVVGGMPVGVFRGPLQPTSSVNPVDYKLWQLQQQGGGSELLGDSPNGLILGSDEEATDSRRAVPSPANSSAAKPALSVDELRLRREEQLRNVERERIQKLESLVVSAEKAAADQYYGAARERLRRAIRLAKPEEIGPLQAKLDKLVGQR